MWKKYRHKQYQTTTAKIALAALALLVSIVLIGKTVNLISSLNRSYSPELGVNKHYALNQELVANVVMLSLQGDQTFKLTVISLHPNENKAIVLNIANETYLELPKGLGAWPLSSVWRLGQEEQPPQGASLLKLAVSQLLGLPIDGLIIFEQSQFNRSATELLGEWRKNPWLLLTFLKSVKTDLSLTEVMWFLKQATSLRSDRIITLDLAESVITESKLLPDSSRVLSVDQVKLDLFVREKMSDRRIAQEAATIAIFNATKYQGLASHAARMVTNLGGNVVLISNSTQQLSNSKVLLKEPSNQAHQQTATRMSQIFAPSCLQQSCLVDDPKIVNSRAQVLIVLGEDYFKLWYER